MGVGVVVAVVVGDRRERSGVLVQGERRQAHPVALELADELGDEVLGLHRRATVAADEHLAPAFVACDDQRRRPRGGLVGEVREHRPRLARVPFSAARPARSLANLEKFAHRSGSGGRPGARQGSVEVFWFPCIGQR